MARARASGELFRWHTSKVGELASAQNGARFVDLVHNNGAPSGISQSVATTAGQSYRLSSWMSGPGSFNPNPRQVLVDVTGMMPQSFTTPLPINSDAIRWELKTFDFTATSDATTIAFRAPVNSAGHWGPVIDHVALTAVPEPSTFALLGAGLLALGVVARRRRGH